MPANRKKEDGGATRQRIEQLERLVKDLISERSGRISEDPQSARIETRNMSPDVQNSNSAGKTVVDGSYSVFHGGNDWHLVLQEVPIALVAIICSPSS